MTEVFHTGMTRHEKHFIKIQCRSTHKYSHPCMCIYDNSKYRLKKNEATYIERITLPQEFLHRHLPGTCNTWKAGHLQGFQL